MVGVVSASALGSKNVWVKFYRERCHCLLPSAQRHPLLGGISSTVVSFRSLVLVRFSDPEVVRFSEGPL